MKQKLSAAMCLLVVLVLALSGCRPAANESAPSSSPAAALQPPDGWYETTDGVRILLYLSQTQGEWQAQQYASDILHVALAESEQAGYRLFEITPADAGGIGTAEAIFSCEGTGGVVSQCALSCFVNEVYLLEVVSAGVEERQPPDDTQPQTVLRYELDYRRAAPLLQEAFGAKAIDDARSVIEAFLAGKTSINLTPDGNAIGYMNTLGCILDVMCPPFAVLTDFNALKAYRGGEMRWQYTVSGDTLDAALRAFEARVCEMVRRIDERDCETAQAMILYNALTQDAVYDYDALTDEEDARASCSYAAIMDQSGWCTAYAYALCFLYAQVGIDSIPVSGESPDMLHMWPLVRLNGELYYCDPTWDIGGGFKYFGLNDEDRCGWAGGFDKSTFRICGNGPGSVFGVNGSRFSGLHESLVEGDAAFKLHHSTQTAEFSAGAFLFACAA